MHTEFCLWQGRHHGIHYGSHGNRLHAQAKLHAPSMIERRQAHQTDALTAALHHHLTQARDISTVYRNVDHALMSATRQQRRAR